MSQRRETGRRGEDEACRFLEARGHTVLARNWRSGHQELDIITLEAGVLHFVEVKTRVAPMTASPEDSVGFVKQRNVTQAAKAFVRSLSGTSIRYSEIFFDVLTVVYSGDEITVEYYPQAFIPMFL